jgi:two-component system, NarL family, invasion response regulator UvrY
MTRILILEAHQVVRKGLEYFINCQLPGSVFGEAGTVDDALRLASEPEWSLAVLGSVPGEPSVLDVLKRLKQIQPLLPVLILDQHSDLEFAVRAYQDGAAGYIAKDSPREELVKAVAYVSAGRGYVSAAIAEGLAADLGRANAPPHHRCLSHREFELVCLIASGKTLAGIACLLGLSDKTVQTYRTRVLDKMHLKNNAEITRYAILNRLAELPARARPAGMPIISI